MENKMIEIKINRWDEKQIFGRITKQDYISFFPKQNVPLVRNSGGSRWTVTQSPLSHLPSALDCSSSRDCGPRSGRCRLPEGRARKLSLGN